MREQVTVDAELHEALVSFYAASIATTGKMNKHCKKSFARVEKVYDILDEQCRKHNEAINAK